MSEPVETDAVRQLPLPLDPASVAISVVPCPHCNNGRRDWTDTDEEDEPWIGGCCDGYGLALDVPPGLEPLVLYLAANAAGGWAFANRQDYTRHLSTAYCEDVEERALRVLGTRPPHDNGARITPTYPGSTEEAKDKAWLAQDR